MRLLRVEPGSMLSSVSRQRRPLRPWGFRRVEPQSFPEGVLGRIPLPQFLRAFPGRGFIRETFSKYVVGLPGIWMMRTSHSAAKTTRVPFGIRWLPGLAFCTEPRPSGSEEITWVCDGTAARLGSPGLTACAKAATVASPVRTVNRLCERREVGGCALRDAGHRVRWLLQPRARGQREPRPGDIGAGGGHGVVRAATCAAHLGCGAGSRHDGRTRPRDWVPRGACQRAFARGGESCTRVCPATPLATSLTRTVHVPGASLYAVGS